jgi:hypothetical protein
VNLAFHVIFTESGPDKVKQFLSQKQHQSQIYLFWVTEKSCNSLPINANPEKSRSNSDLWNLIKLLTAHPAFSTRPGLVTPLFAQMSQLLGLDNATIEAIREKLVHANYLLIATENLDHIIQNIDEITVIENFNIKLQSNFHSMIKKASLHLLQLTAAEINAERLHNDLSIQHS